MGGSGRGFRFLTALVFYSICIFSYASSDHKTPNMQLQFQKFISSTQETKATAYPQHAAHHDILYAVVRAGGGGGGGGRGGGGTGGGKSGGRSGGGSGSGGAGGAGAGGSHKSSGVPSAKSLTWMSGAGQVVVLTALYFMM